MTFDIIYIDVKERCSVTEAFAVMAEALRLWPTTRSYYE